MPENTVKVIQGDELKKGDAEPRLEVKLVKPDGTPRDLTSVDDVKLHFQESGSSSLDIDASMQITDGEQGKVAYDWAHDGTDTSTVGTHDAEFIVEDTDGTSFTETFPGNGTTKINIEDTLE